MEIKWNELKEKIRKFFNGTKSILLIVLSMAVGAYGYKTLTEMLSTKSYQHPTNSITQTSVAVNEREELIIFNRVTGDYTIYDSEVYKAIFDLQVKKIQVDIKTKEPIKK